jgi:hypothetical protein
MRSQASIDFLLLSFRQGRLLHLRRNTVPNLLNQRERFSDAQFVNPQRLKLW